MNLPLYIRFVDYEQAFDSVDRESLYKLMKHYRIPQKIISIIRSLCRARNVAFINLTNYEMKFKGLQSAAWGSGVP